MNGFVLALLISGQILFYGAFSIFAALLYLDWVGITFRHKRGILAGDRFFHFLAWTFTIAAIGFASIAVSSLLNSQPLEGMVSSAVGLLLLKASRSQYAKVENKKSKKAVNHASHISRLRK